MLNYKSRPSPRLRLLSAFLPSTTRSHALSATVAGRILASPPPPPPPAQDFDRDWRFGRFTYDRLVGTYLFPQPEVGGGDAMVVVEEDGRDDWHERNDGGRMRRCSMGTEYQGFEVGRGWLGMWRKCIESEEWRVGEEGVEGEGR